MATWHGDKRTAVALVGRELARRGWKLWGWKEDRSDSMTDYYDPEAWSGVATHDEAAPGVVVCVDVSRHHADEQSGARDPRRTMQRGPCTPCNGTGKRLHAAEAYTYMILHTGQTVTEPAKAAGEPCDWCEGAGQREEARPDPTAPQWPVFQATPKGAAWHVERGCRIVARGVGVFTLAAERWKGQHAVPGDPEPLDDVTCEQCGQTGTAHKLRREDCPKARPGTRALVDRIEAAAFGPRRANAAPDAPQAVDGLTVRPGKPGNVEVLFPAKPDDAARDELKAAGFRWYRRGGFWYGPAASLPARYGPAAEGVVS